MNSSAFAQEFSSGIGIFESGGNNSSDGFFGPFSENDGSLVLPKLAEILDEEAELKLSWLSDIDPDRLPDFDSLQVDPTLIVVSPFSEADLEFGDTSVEVVSALYDLEAYCDDPLINQESLLAGGSHFETPPVLIIGSWWLNYIQENKHTKCANFLDVMSSLGQITPELKFNAFPIAFEGFAPIETKSDHLPDWISPLHLAYASMGFLPEGLQMGPYREPSKVCVAWTAQPEIADYYRIVKEAECFDGLRNGRRVIGSLQTIWIDPLESHADGPRQDVVSARPVFMPVSEDGSAIEYLDNRIDNWSNFEYGVRGQRLDVRVFDTRVSGVGSNVARDPRSSSYGAIVTRPYSLCYFVAEKYLANQGVTVFNQVRDGCYWSPRAMFAHRETDGLAWTDHIGTSEEFVGEALVWTSLSDLFLNASVKSHVFSSGQAQILTVADLTDEERLEFSSHLKEIAWKLLHEKVNFTDSIWVIAHKDISSEATWNTISKYISEVNFERNDAYSGGLLPLSRVLQAIED